MIASREYVIKTMVSLLANPKKKYSQNFLTDYQVVKDSVASLGDIENVIEIGPGLGALTEELVLKNKVVYAYEIDKVMIEHLKKYFSSQSNFHLIEGDFLKQKLSYNQKVSFISNIPYSLTTPIIEKVITSSLDIESFVFMLQKEAGMRITAKMGSKDYGPLPIMLTYLGKIEVISKVTRDKFIPSPNVDSVVMKLTFKSNRDFDYEKKLFTLLKNSFAMRRKTLMNNLKGYYSRESLSKCFIELGFKESIRPEELSLNSYLELLDFLYK